MSKRGLYGKYVIQKANDGPSSTVGVRSAQLGTEGAVYFTLRLDTDVHARAAVRAYIESCREDEPELARDLEEILRKLTTET